MNQKSNFLSNYEIKTWHTNEVHVDKCFELKVNVLKKIKSYSSYIWWHFQKDAYLRAAQALFSCSQKLQYNFFFNSEQLSDVSVCNIISMMTDYYSFAVTLRYCIRLYYNKAVCLDYNTDDFKFYNLGIREMELSWLKRQAATEHFTRL